MNDFCIQIKKGENTPKLISASVVSREEAAPGVIGKLQGFLNARKILDDVEIDYIFVSEMLRGQKIASKIIEELECFFSCFKVTRYTLEVGAQNLSARSFYEKMGYQLIGRRDQYYKDGEDALVLEKRVSIISVKELYRRD